MGILLYDLPALYITR